MSIQNPYSLATRWFVEHERCDRHRLDMAVHFQEPQPLDHPEGEAYAREDGMAQGIGFLSGMPPHLFPLLTREQLKCIRGDLCELAKLMNPYVNAAERRAWDSAFRLEILARLDDMTIEKWGVL